MKFLFASDSFKGTLSCEKTAELLTKAAKQVFPQCSCSGVPVADGGEGTADAVLSAMGGSKVMLEVHDPLMRSLQASYGRIDENRAIIEMAAASGLPLLTEAEYNPATTTSYGTGELIAAALQAGCKDITIAIGGSATNDGGMGCMCALGVRFLDKNGQELTGVGDNLKQVAHIDTSGMLPQVKEASFTVICDVTNPLCGKNGATYTYGPQKGGTPQLLVELEEGMCNYRDVIIKEFGINLDELSGAGAAGGLGGALAVFLKARMKPGSETVLDLIAFDSRLQDVSLVITGEGRLDWQSCFGKVVQGVGLRCKKRSVPAVALVGSTGTGAEQILQHGITAIVKTAPDDMPASEALARAEELYFSAAVRMFQKIKHGEIL
ncbi:MAG: glycerate kinase [Lachnospiraceae bacterium]|nr:glycerate kinase [Lachnospiraceae bacterium]